MSEALKTSIYAGVALVVSLAAFLSRPKVEEFEVQDIVGKPLFENFDDPAKAGRLQIVKYDDELGTLQRFEVARDKESKAWTIPSHGGYPADAEDRMRDAALLLVDLQVLDVASEEAGDHEMFGVVEPDKDKLRVGDVGVGQLVSFEDLKGDDLASLVIGGKVKGNEELRFVRIPGQDILYVVNIDPDKLSTKFEDWIEKDLLKMNAWDVKSATVKNYTVSKQSMTTVAMDRKFDLSARYEDNKWQLDSLMEYTNGRPAEVTLTEDEELNGDKLNELKNAVDGLEIIDVRRKPTGLGGDLKAGEGFAKNNEGIADLNRHGFYVMSAPEGGYEVLSANGEIYVGMDSGTEYVLRFGDVVPNASDDAGEEGDSRYLFVTARVDMSKFPSPELEPEPEIPTADSKKDAEDDASAAAEEQPAEESEAEGAEEAGDGEETAGSEKAEEAADADAEAGDAEDGDAEDGDAEGESTDADLEAREAEAVAELARVKKENQRKLDEWNEKLDKARGEVAELNIRFADWYYVVSEEQFQKVQLDRDDLIKQKEKEEGDDTTSTSDAEPAVEESVEEMDEVETFQDLQQEGLEADDE
jgi:hypothetical protein